MNYLSEYEKNKSARETYLKFFFHLHNEVFDILEETHLYDVELYEDLVKRNMMFNCILNKQKLITDTAKRFFELSKCGINISTTYDAVIAHFENDNKFFESIAAIRGFNNSFEEIVADNNDYFLNVVCGSSEFFDSIRFLSKKRCSLENKLDIVTKAESVDIEGIATIRTQKVISKNIKNARLLENYMDLEVGFVTAFEKTFDSAIDKLLDEDENIVCAKITSEVTMANFALTSLDLN